MTTEQYKEVNDALIEFVVRVSKGETTSEKEVEVLPEIVSTLCELANTCQKIGF